MALNASLGFGMMRLPVKNGDPTDFDYEQLNSMVDAYMKEGYNYFDTSYVYHNGKSEEAVRKAVVERYPREAIRIATKFPTFLLQSGDEDKIEAYFQEQLDRLGVDYVDYYLLHNFQTRYYDGYDGKGGVIQSEHLIEHALKWKAEGKIRHLGFSFHSSAKLLDRILTEHPEFEFVQIAVNYLDWNSQLVQAGDCYEVIRRHGKQLVAMEPVKGGGLAMVPAPVEKALKAISPKRSVASWAIRFVGSLEGLICCLSGMSTLEQVQDNIRSYQEFKIVDKAEKKWLTEDVAALYRAQGPVKDLSKYEGLTLYGVQVGAIMEAYSVCQLQPDPGFSDDNNYLRNAIAEQAHLNFEEDLPRQQLINREGVDVTEEVYAAYEWLRANSF
ncbi:MAG: aldo/keto reductase [Oscillospiraceae bacterium]|nr:aldo/keto reductase [Oscillospiraceae bacterium]